MVVDHRHPQKIDCHPQRGKDEVLQACPDLKRFLFVTHEEVARQGKELHDHVDVEQIPRKQNRKHGTKEKMQQHEEVGTEPFAPQVGTTNTLMFVVRNWEFGTYNSTGLLYRGEIAYEHNRPPTADSQSVSTPKNTPLAIILTTYDADYDPLTYSIVTQPVNGTLSGTGPEITYTPNPDYKGQDSFTFKVNDGAVDSALATVSITVRTETSPVFDTNPDTGKIAAASLPATFTCSDLNISATNIGIGESATISVRVSNNGGSSDSYTVSLKIDGEEVATKEVTLAGSDSQRVTFDISQDTEGTYSVDVNGLSGTFMVQSAALPEGTNWWIVGAIITIVVAAITATWNTRRLLSR